MRVKTMIIKTDDWPKAEMCDQWSQTQMPQICDQRSSEKFQTWLVWPTSQEYSSGAFISVKADLWIVKEAVKVKSKHGMSPHN